jgi:Trk K+ transport system NAD-binding subunit
LATDSRESKVEQAPVILCGLGRVGSRVLDYLRATGLPIVVVDNSCMLNDPRLDSVRLVQGDCRRREVLEQAGVAAARGVLILTSDDLVNISTALMVRRIHPDVRVVMRMFNQNLISRLGKAVHNVHALSTSTLTAPLLALTAVTGQALGTFRLDGIHDGRRQVAEVLVASGSPLRGQSAAEISARLNGQVVAHLPAGGTRRFLGDVAADTRLEPGDRLVVCATPHALATALPNLDDEGQPGLLWASRLRRFGRVAWRTLIEVDLAVKICGAVLVGVILLSTVVFYFGIEKGERDFHKIAYALYRTISLIATGADMGLAEFSNSPRMMIYVSGLRLFGAALTAAFTAIVTNFLLRARLGGALEVRRIPDGGHIIVCGLGNVGYRVVEELVGTADPVLAIELAQDGRFVATARRLGVVVITGDATVREVLRQAHAATARAVIAVTDSDLVNLEVALLARELKAKQRVVVRMSDANLAETLREAANVRFALSIPTLAAPAFVAALFGDRVLSVFLVGGRLLAAVDVVVQPADALLIGQTVRAIAVDYRFQPVAIVTAEGQALEPLPAARLSAGDRLVGIAALTDLERLLSRQPVPRDQAVDVTAFAPSALAVLLKLLQTERGLNAEEASKRAEQLPICLGEGLTRGQAEELLDRLGHDGVTGKMRKYG